MRIGSLFSGAGGLDMAVQHVFGGNAIWHCENDAAASKVLAAHWPNVPNLGDITAIDWSDIEPADILCGGYPCQPFSHAGQRKGTDDERHLWPYFAEAIRHLRPRFVVLENVAGHRTMGFDSVLAELAVIGYDAQWCSVRASDVGAPHRRERLFCLATDSTCDGWDEGWAESARLVGGFDVAVGGTGPVDLLPTPNATPLSSSLDLTCSGDGRDTPNKLGWAVSELLSTPQSRDYKGVPSDSFNQANLCRDVADAAQWGKYERAISRWESLTRPAPAPTEPNTKGNPRLSASFSEWMMGWPQGWVTQVDGIRRNDQLRIIGNGVVPQQAIAALQWLLRVSELAA